MFKKQQQHNKVLDNEDKKEMDKKTLEDQQFEIIKEIMDEEDKAAVKKEVVPEEQVAPSSIPLLETSSVPLQAMDTSAKEETLSVPFEEEETSSVPFEEEETSSVPFTNDNFPKETKAVVVNKINDLRKDLSSELDHEQLVRNREHSKMERRKKLRTMRVRRGEMNNLMKYY